MFLAGGDTIPDGYKQRNGQRYGYYEGRNGKRYYYKPGNPSARDIAKKKANRGNKLGNILRR